MEIDIRTIILILGFTHLMQMLVFFHQYKVNKTYNGTGWWLLWSASEIIGFTFILLRNIPSLLPVVIIVQNSMIVAGTLFLYIGVRRFFNLDLNIRLVAVIGSAFFTGLLCFLFIYDDIQIRSGLLSLTLATSSLLTAHCLIINKKGAIAASANFLTAVFLVHGGIFIYRTMMIIAGTPVESFFTPSLFNILPYFDALIVSLLWTFGFIIMINQQLNTDISETQKDMQLIFNLSPDAAVISRIDDGLVVDVNEGYSTLTGYSRKELIGKLITDINIWKNIADRNKLIAKLKERGYCNNHEAVFVRKDGHEIIGLVSAKIISIHGTPHIVSISRDITLIKEAENSLKQSEHDKSDLLEKLNEAQHIALIGSWEWNLQTDHVWWSDECYRIFGVTPQTFVPGFEANNRFIHPDDLETYNKHFEHSLQTGEPLDFKVRLITGVGLIKHSLAKGNVFKDGKGQSHRIVGTIMDITEQRLAEEKVLKVNRIYAFISQINQAIVHVKNKDEVYKEVCRIAVETGKFHMAWIGLVDEPSKTIVPKIHAGVEDGYLSSIKKISIENVPEGHGPTGSALRERKHFICNDYENDPNVVIWRDEALIRGYRSSIALPIFYFGNVYGVFTLYASTPYFFDEQEVTILSEVTDDIGFALEVIETEEKRKQAEKELLVSEEYFRNVFEHSTVGKSITEIGGKLKTNRAYRQMLGYSEEELATLRWQDITHPGDLTRDQLNLDSIVAGKTTSVQWEKRYIHKDGHIVWVDIGTVLQRDNTGKPLYFITTIQDITDRKNANEALLESELRYRALVENMQIGVVTHGPDTSVLFSNPMASRLLGLTRDQMQGKTAVDPSWCFIHEDLTKMEISEYPVNLTISANNSLSNIVLGIVRPDIETPVWVQCATHLIRNYQEDIQEVVVTFFDYTRRKVAEDIIIRFNETLEQRVEERTNQLQVANRELEAFSYSVSHDLRAPLRGIHGFTEILVEDYKDKLDDEGKRICMIIRDNSLKMGRLIDDLLAFSRLGRVEMELSVINMKEMVTSVYEEITDPKSRERITLNVDELCRAPADPIMLHQVWSNLISNAIKYSSKKEKTIITIASKSENDRCVYWITDNGAGFDMTYLHKIFGVFQRLHSEKDYPGTGVGLAIVQRIVQRHGGEVWAEGEVDKGASFYFSLPRSDQAD